MSLGKTIRDARKQKGITLATLARGARVTASHLSRIESRQIERGVSQRTLRRIAQTLDLDFDRLCVLAGHVPEDVARFITSSPSALEAVRGVMRTQAAAA
jgi:transcriptional regulator with XRE-family HTH domain